MAKGKKYKNKKGGGTSFLRCHPLVADLINAFATGIKNEGYRVSQRTAQSLAILGLVKLWQHSHGEKRGGEMTMSKAKLVSKISMSDIKRVEDDLMAGKQWVD